MNVRVHVGLQSDNEYVDDNNLLALRHHLPHEHCRSSLAPLCSSCKTWPAKLVSEQSERRQVHHGCPRFGPG